MDSVQGLINVWDEEDVEPTDKHYKVIKWLLILIITNYRFNIMRFSIWKYQIRDDTEKVDMVTEDIDRLDELSKLADSIYYSKEKISAKTVLDTTIQAIKAYGQIIRLYEDGYWQEWVKVDKEDVENDDI